jgi:hypothetical protein
VSLPPSVSALPKPLIRLGQQSSKIVGVYATGLRNFLTSCHTDYDRFCSIAKEILEQKAICQQDPDQDADEEAPEDQAEYDSVLISSAGDLVAAMANALGSDFASAFNAFFPLIAKYYVRDTSLFSDDRPTTLYLPRKKAALSAIALRPLDAWQKSFLG